MIIIVTILYIEKTQKNARTEVPLCVKLLYLIDISSEIDAFFFSHFCPLGERGPIFVCFLFFDIFSASCVEKGQDETGSFLIFLVSRV